MSRIQPIALAIAVAIVAIVAGMLLSRALMQPVAPAQPLASGTLLDPPRALPAMPEAPEGGFVDQDQQPFDSERLQERWSLMFFGFTSCPDICPMTLGMLAQTEKLLADLPAAQRPQVILVSVDAQRDTPAQLSSYVKFFSPSFTGITAPQDVIEDFARQMGVVVAITPLEGGGYTVDHSASIFLVDPQGAMRALFSAPHTAAQLAEDYRRVIAAGR